GGCSRASRVTMAGPSSLTGQVARVPSGKGGWCTQRRNTVLSKHAFAVTVVLLLAFVRQAPAASRAVAPAAPLEWLGHVRWVNHAALSPDSLRGRVVLVAFWTFACINCRRTVPALRTIARRWSA